MLDTETMAAAAYQHFKDGKDTDQIAAIMKINGATASRLVWLGRCAEKRLPAISLDNRGYQRHHNMKDAA